LEIVYHTSGVYRVIRVTAAAALAWALEGRALHAQMPATR
jgi:hypothetical protein